MRVSQRTVAILLSDEGHEVMQLAIPGLPNSRVVSMYVQDTDEMGLWVRAQREDGEHLLLVRWEFVLSMDFPAGETKAVGLRP